MPCYKCPTKCDFLGNYKINKQLLRDCLIVVAARKLISEDTEANYDALKALVNAKLAALSKPDARVVFIKSDGLYIFDNQKTYEEAKLVENHNTREEQVLAWNWHFGIIGEKAVPEFWKEIYDTQGYSVAVRPSSTVGTSSYYVSKVISRCPGATDPEAFTSRVS